MKKIVKSKSFLGSILFAASLWGYTSLNHEYTPLVKVPLSVLLPSDKAVENPLPGNISIKVKGTGWQLFYLIYFNSTKECIVDLSDQEIPVEEYIITRMDILKGIQNIVDVEPIDVLPESMKLIIGQLVTRKVPVNPIISITPREGFVAMSNFKISPDSIEITGNETTIRNIRFWNTNVSNVEGVYKPTTLALPLSDTLSTIIKISRATVNIYFDVQQEADITIYDVPIHIRGGSLPKNHKLKPDKINVIVQGGINQISEISKYDIESYIDYSELISDTTGIVKPKIEINQAVNKFYALPTYIYHYRIVKTLE
ncbi:MAG: CdaR family protein [bacterium]